MIKLIRTVLPEERKNRIPCIAFGSAILVLAVANIIKWVIV